MHLHGLSRNAGFELQRFRQSVQCVSALRPRVYAAGQRLPQHVRQEEPPELPLHQGRKRPVHRVCAGVFYGREV